VEDLLHNPVYNALLTRDAHHNIGSGRVTYFHEEVSPFAGFSEEHREGFDELYQLLPAGRKILYATPARIQQPAGWYLRAEVEGLQFIYTGTGASNYDLSGLTPLGKANVPEMMALAALTKPGPFGLRTIEFGHYFGIFESGRLVAMTGQRLHAGNHTEISAVCTHPAYLGKGFAATLMQHQLNLILNHGEQPYLHVRADNKRAIALYERLQFKVNRTMNFYFMERGS
jgi:ribosomal protein S18 acetylase RimI-like enzyme